jgi:hypothetical protein
MCRDDPYSDTSPTTSECGSRSSRGRRELWPEYAGHTSSSTCPCCALGHDLEAEEGGAITTQGRDAASAASALAVGQMFHLRRVNLGLIDAGRSAQLERAASISSDSVAEIALGPPSPAQLQELLDREEAIAKAVDERYALLGHAVTSDPVFEGVLLDELRSVIVDDGSTHAASVAALRDLLGDLAPAEFLRATPFRGFAVTAMDGLNDSNRVLVQRGLLPPFTLP